MNKTLLRTRGSGISAFSTVVGITLVLTMLGVLYIFLLVAQAVNTHFREQLMIQVMLKQDVEEQKILDLKRKIEGEDYSGEVSYTSGEAAARLMQEELGEEFIDFLGYNPLPGSIDIKINPDFGDLDSLNSFAAALEKHEIVDEVVYQKGLLKQLNENISKWGIGLLILGVLLLIIAVALIVITIQLAVYSQRFIIKSMQLVGATHWFIQKPFLKQGLWYGLISSIFALGIISGLLFYFKVQLGDVVEILKGGNRYLMLCGGVMITGLLVSWLATAYAVQRFVRLGKNSLY